MYVLTVGLQQFVLNPHNPVISQQLLFFIPLLQAKTSHWYAQGAMSSFARIAHRKLGSLCVMHAMNHSVMTVQNLVSVIVSVKV